MLRQQPLVLRPLCRPHNGAVLSRAFSQSPVLIKLGRGQLPVQAVGTDAVDPQELLAQPTWSVRSPLLPDKQAISVPENTITTDQLHHLLRLSALPSSASPKVLSKMAETLLAQLHFVRNIQGVDTSGVEPLRSIRDETEEGLREQTIGVEQLQTALSREKIFGHSKRPRRQKRRADTSGVEDWDPLATASQKAGRYFVVRSGK